MLAEFDHVEMRRRSHPVDKNQLMLGTIKRSHAGIRLVPDAQVQALAVDGGADRRDAVHVPPVHADKVDGAIARQTRRCAKSVSEEGAELRLAHLTRGHGELAMASGGHRMASNSHIVGRIEESGIDTRAVTNYSLQIFGVAAVATSHPMLAENPDITGPRPWRFRNRGNDLIIGIGSRRQMTSISPVEKPVRAGSISTSIEASSLSSFCRISRSQPALSAILLSAIRSARFCTSDRPDRMIVGTSASPIALAA